VARTGKFGRQPRVATSLTNTLVAIAREFQNQRASNIMDAWAKGGTFEGKKATDEVVMKFWKDKVKGVSKDDPLHDTYKNASTQLEYTIAESKMTASYATKGKTDAQMVAFYLNWAKKVPKNSEFWRSLQRDAGQYMRTARSTAKASNRQAIEARYQRQQAATRQELEAGGEYMIETLRQLAQSGYADGGISQVISGAAGESDAWFTDFQSGERDPDTMQRLIGLITRQGTTVNESTGFTVGDGEFEGNSDVLFHDDDGKGITGIDIMKQMAKLDPNFVAGDAFDVAYIDGVLNTQMKGINQRIKRAKETAHLGDVQSLMKVKSYVAELRRENASYPLHTAYMDSADDYNSVANDPSASPMALDKAWTKRAAELTQFIADPSIATNDALRSRLTAELNGEAGVPTWEESFTGLSDGDFTMNSTRAAVNMARVTEARDVIAAVQNNDDIVWAYGSKDANGQFQPGAGGMVLGASTREAAFAGGLMAQTITVHDAATGADLQVVVSAKPVMAVATDPRSGEPLDYEKNAPIAYAFDIPSGNGRATTSFGVNTAEGFRFMDNDDPIWDPALQPYDSGDHLEVNFTPYLRAMWGEQDPLTGAFDKAPNLNANTSLGYGFNVQEATYKQEGVITFDPITTAWETGDRRAIGGIDPMSDFASLTVKTLMNTPEGVTILQNLDSHPLFKQQIEDDNLAYSGFTRDVATGEIVPGPNANQALLDKATQQMTMASEAKGLVDFIAKARDTWQRDTTGSPASESGQHKTGATPWETADGVAKLATDMVEGTPFEAIGKYFMQGSTQPKPQPIDGPKGLEIKTDINLTVPSYVPPKQKDDVYVTQGPKPKDTQTQTQQGSGSGTATQTQTQTQQGSGSGSNISGWNTRGR
jgi:hypothetical protein